MAVSNHLIKTVPLSVRSRLYQRLNLFDMFSSSNVWDCDKVVSFRQTHNFNFNFLRTHFISFFAGDSKKKMDDYRDRISRLPDDFLLQILSRLPTKDVVAMSLLSKRWRFLWTLVPKLNFDVRLHDNTCPKFTKFVDRSLLLHKAPTLESLRVKIGSICHNADVDVSVWVRIAVDRGVRELDISYCPAEEPIRLPKCLFPCATLVVLKLENMSLVDASSYVCFKSLKTLHLLDVKYFDEQSLPHLLSSCYVLEDLVVQRCPGDNVKIVSVNAACLKTLTLHKSSQAFEGDDDGFLIAAPKLKRLDIEDYWGGFCYIENMPEVVEANVDVIYKTTERILGSLTSVKRLALCLMTSDVMFSHFTSVA